MSGGTGTDDRGPIAVPVATAAPPAPGATGTDDRRPVTATVASPESPGRPAPGGG